MNIQIIHIPTPQILFNTMKDRAEAIQMEVDIKTPHGIRRKLYVEGTLSIFQGGDQGETLREVEIEMVSLPRKISGGHIYTEITDLISGEILARIEDAVIEKSI